MTDILLKELDRADIDWMIGAGRKQELSVGTKLIESGREPNACHLLLEGVLAMEIDREDNDNPLTRAFAALSENQTSGWEILKLTGGEVVGEIPFAKMPRSRISVRAIEPSLVLSISKPELSEKLREDVGFAARFYRAISMLLLRRLEKAGEQLGRTRSLRAAPARDMLFILGELNDSDVEWLVRSGKDRTVTAGTTLIRQGVPIDALYILLDGILRLSVREARENPLARIFAAIEETAPADEREISRLSRGEIVGESFFIDGRLPSETTAALTDCRVLAIPRQLLANKLQQDVGFSGRFYRVIVTLLANRLQDVFKRLGYGKSDASRPRAIARAFDDELDLAFLDDLTLAGTKFHWMLERLEAS